MDRHSKRSNKNESRRYRRRRRRHHQRRHRRGQEEKEIFLQQFIIEQNAQLRELMEMHQLEITELKSEIEKFRGLAKKIDDEIEWVVHGVCGVQHHLEELDCQRRMEMAIKEDSI